MHTGLARAIAVYGLAFAALAVAVGWLARRLEGAHEDLFCRLAVITIEVTQPAIAGADRQVCDALVPYRRK
ncbi:MAG: hypothetical protein ABGY42_07530 [bacterium]